MINIQEFLMESTNYSEIEHINTLKEIYFKKENNYLEVLYFEILRNSNSDNFDEYCLINLLSSSEYLNSRIFQILSKNKEDLKLIEFISGIGLVFSKFLPSKGKQLTEMIFYLISNNTESITYQSIKEFANNLIFDCFCRAQIYEYQFFILFTKDISRLIKKTFSIGIKKKKFYKFYKNEFFLIIEENTLFIKILILLLNLISQINEKMICKLIQTNEITILNNDDFEKEFEIEYDKTPRINSLPKEHSLNFQNFVLNPPYKQKYFVDTSNWLNNELSFGNNNNNNIYKFNCSFQNENQLHDASFESINGDINNNDLNKILIKSHVQKIIIL